MNDMKCQSLGDRCQVAKRDRAAPERGFMTRSILVRQHVLKFFLIQLVYCIAAGRRPVVFGVKVAQIGE